MEETTKGWNDMEPEKKNDGSNGNKTLKMYFVATIQDLHSTPYPLKESTRVVGYFLDLEEAMECVEGNWGDLYEAGYYKYAVIEDVEPGIYQSIHSRPLCYQWEGDADTGSYCRIEKPEAWKNIYGFTIG